MEQFEYAPVYAQGDPGNGIGGYDLADPRDQPFAFDYDSSGKLDHLVLYRPGTGTIWFLKNTGGTFSPLGPPTGSPGNGIGGYDLIDSADRAFAFDYDGSGKLDHLVLYRPGTGTIWFLKNNGGTFSAIAPSTGSPGNGIGGYDLADPRDQAFAFDYDSSGKPDHLVLYRPGTGTIWFLKNNGGTFSAIAPSTGSPGNGIGGYDLIDSADRAFSFDYDSSGKLDHVVLYRPGTGTIWFLKNNGGTFSAIAPSTGSPGNGIGGYDLADPRDRAFAFDYDGSGKLDHLVLYRPGTGIFWILKNAGGIFSSVYAEGSTGLGDYDLASSADRAFAFDYNGTGRPDHLVLYRPGTGTVWIFKQQPALPPTIIDFAPRDGVQGDTVVIRGDRLRRTTRVVFNNAVANIVNKQNQWISSIVPNTRSGPITVQTPTGIVTSSTPFQILPPPIVLSFTPTSGKVGTGVTITGRNFRRVNAVRFNGVQANFTLGSDTTVTSTVPTNASSGPITVVCAGGTATSANFQVIIAPLPADLGFIDTWIVPTQFPTAGSPFTVYFSFLNGGGTATGTFTIRLQLDNGTLIQDVTAPSYAAGTGDAVYMNFANGLPAGDHFVYAYLDITNHVSEVSKQNNVIYNGFKVT